MYTQQLLSTTFIVAAVCCAGLVASCSDDSASTGSLDLYVTDAAVDTAEEVVVEFTGATIQGAGGQQTFTFPARQIDLLALQGDEAEKILDGQTLAVGDYSWIRLVVEDTNSYIVVNGTAHDLTIPSGSESGLKLNRSFTIEAGVNTSFTIDFDLRKSVVNTAKGYQLRPTLRIIDDFTKGVLNGTVDATLLGTECTDASIYAGAVYVFENSVTVPDDLDGTDDADIVTSGLVDTDTYNYTIGQLESGDYKISFTCGDDDPDADDALSFTAVAAVTIEAGKATEQDINP